MSAEDDEFQLQLRLEAAEKERQEQLQKNGSDPYTYTDPSDGTVYEWDHEKRAWFPKLSEDFMASYQANYGNFAENSSQPTDTLTASSVLPENVIPPIADAGQNMVEDETPEQEPNEPSSSMTFGTNIAKKKGLNSLKRPAATWFEVDEMQNTKVYVQGLPTENFDDEKFVELMSKCGMVMKDETGKYKIKLYRNGDGSLKGDGLCCYIKVESVDLALQILDGYSINDKELHVERAQFQQKGDYDPAKKPKQKKRKDKEKLKKKIDALFAWKPDKLRGERNKWENTVVIKNFFEPKDFDEDARLILEYQKDLRDEFQEKFGEVKKCVIYDRNPEGVATVQFKDVESADACVAATRGRFFAGRQLAADLWDGKTKYKIMETEEQLEERMKKWDEFLEKGD